MEPFAMSDEPREKPLVRSRIEALLSKATNCEADPGEAASSLATARELAGRYGFSPDEFRWRVAAETQAETEMPTKEPDADPEPPKAARGGGIGMLARQMIIDHPDWTYARIASEVNNRIEGARSTAHSVRWYSNAMRREGLIGTKTRRLRTGDRRNSIGPS
jgi:hypothetical protein